MTTTHTAASPISSIVLLLGAVLSAWGQVTGGTFTGVTKDSSGAVVPGVRIVIRSVSTQVETPLMTNAQGVFTAPFLAAGDYMLTGEKDGFAKEVFGPVTLQVNQTVRVDFALTVGALSQTVDVKASGAQLVQTETGEISQVIGERQIGQMPLNGRDWTQLIALSAGVTTGSPGESGTPDSYNINGSRSKNNLFMIDGTPTNTGEAHTNQITVPLDAIQEFSVSENAFSAQFGNLAGGIFNLQIRSGTNALHGSLFEFFRNEKLDANNFFSNATGQPKNPYRYNQFGGSVGGPIRTDKTFFFGDYQGSRVRNGVPVIATVPNAAQRQGDFSNLRDAKGNLIPIYDPLSTDTSNNRTQFASNGVLNVIPSSRIAPAAKNLLAALPAANRYDARGNPLPFNNYATSHSSATNTNAFDIKVDQNFAESNRMFGRFSFYRLDTQSPGVFGPLGGTLLFAGTNYNHNWNASIGDTHIFHTNLLNEFRLGLNRWQGGLGAANAGQNTAEQFGIAGVNRNADTTGLPFMLISGLFNLGDSIATPDRVADTTYTITDTVAWTLGRHAIHFGFEYAHTQTNFFELVLGRGLYVFEPLMTGRQADLAQTGSFNGNALASFETGFPTQVQRDILDSGVGLRFPRYGLFVQDDFKVSSRLTVNLGLRYDVMPPYTEAHDRMANFDPATKTMIVAGQNGAGGLRHTDYGNVAPRFGFALALTGDRKTVLRGGYGIAYINLLNSTTSSTNLGLNIPFYFRDNLNQAALGLPAYSLSQALPPLLIPPATAPRGNVFYENPQDHNSYLETYNIGVQRALSGSAILELAYVGSHGLHLLYPININAAPPGLTNPATRQPLGAVLGVVNYVSTRADSSYNGLQAKVEKRYSHGLFLLGSYTWSKSLDYESNGLDPATASGNNPQDPNNIRTERGLSAYDRTHRGVISGTYELPYGRNRQFGRSAPRVMQWVLGDWQATGIFVAQSGAPFSVTMACGDVNTQGDNCRPNRLASGAVPEGQQNLNHWFDTTAFAKPKTPVFGNAGRNVLRGPGSWDIDLGIFKNFPWGKERRLIQFRGELFNAFNHPIFGLPNGSIDSPAIGTITTAGPGRQIQLGLRLAF